MSGLRKGTYFFWGEGSWIIYGLLDRAPSSKSCAQSNKRRIWIRSINNRFAYGLRVILSVEDVRKEVGFHAQTKVCEFGISSRGL